MNTYTKKNVCDGQLAWKYNILLNNLSKFVIRALIVFLAIILDILKEFYNAMPSKSGFYLVFSMKDIAKVKSVKKNS